MPLTFQRSISRAISMLSGISMPPLNPSYMLCLTSTEVPVAAAAFITSSRHMRMKRIRLSSEPPYSSRRREELRDEVAVPGVHLDAVETGGMSCSHGLAEVFGNLHYFVPAHFADGGVGV